MTSNCTLGGRRNQQKKAENARFRDKILGPRAISTSGRERPPGEKKTVVSSMTLSILGGHAHRQLLCFGQLHKSSPFLRTSAAVGLSFLGKLLSELPLLLELLDLSGESFFFLLLSRAMGHDGERVYLALFIIAVYALFIISAIVPFI